ncbi:DUF4139 domain-containing protein [Variovorax sp. E3]|uniref:DUF4139 domain-containing protein n=1 Tax=Variovorax sp. E3 TaxID=1914993 RepID=UPI0027DAED5A|nr:DUF4139 domain-containing protein [Variovorax sp. E3]
MRDQRARRPHPRAGRPEGRAAGRERCAGHGQRLPQGPGRRQWRVGRRCARAGRRAQPRRGDRGHAPHGAGLAAQAAPDPAPPERHRPSAQPLAGRAHPRPGQRRQGDGRHGHAGRQRRRDVKLSYQVNGPGWTPTYRALLDSTTRKVRIERQALVAQATGEDWRGVKLVLSTGQPRRETTGRLPSAWRIGVEPPPPPPRARAYEGAPMPAAPIAMAADAKQMMAERRAPLFDVSVFDSSFATEFSIPQAIDVPSNGQRVTLALGQHEDTAKLVARTSPRVDASAFLVAEMAQPEGVWPAGPLLLYRDGAFVGNGRWTAPSDERLTLSFGRDELVRVQAEPERDNQGTGGFAGSRAERKVQRAYVVENRHRTPVAVEVLEAAPVSVDEQVRVSSQFAPKPDELSWNKQPGLTMWRFDLDAGKTARVTADYTIGYPKDARLQMR